MSGIGLGKNIASLAAQRRLNDASSALSRSFERLSSGMRINHASDDAAGLAIATQLNSKARVYSQAIRNVNDGLSAANVAEGALNTLRDISIRQLELAEQAANGTLSTQQRKALNLEANKLVDEFNRIVTGTTFNGMSLFDSSLGSILVQAGYGTAESLQVQFGSALSRGIGSGTFGVGITGYANKYSMSAVDVQVATADFNGDGILDLVQNDQAVSQLHVLLGNGDGTFRWHRNLAMHGEPISVTVNDVNGDGIEDIIAGNFSGVVNVHLGNGNGTFKYFATAYSGGQPHSITVADANNDGNVDLITAGQNGRIYVNLGNGNGTFQASKSSVVPVINYALAVGDFNGDGKLDVISEGYGASPRILVGNGDGTFLAARTLSGSTQGRSIVAGDFNGDGNLDFATGNNNSVNVIIGNGDGTFKAATTLSVVLVAAGLSLISTDINSDGYSDLVLGQLNGRIHTYLGNGDGTFATRITTATSYELNSLVAGDFNGDGRTDMLAGTSYYSYNYSINAATYIGHNVAFLGDGTTTNNISHVNMLTAQGARDTITAINANLTRVQDQLSTIGAATSRLQTALGGIRAKEETFRAAADRILSADIASESANVIRNRIIQEAAAAVLSHANALPELSLKLLRSP